jgi:hypothetical protein
MTCALDYVPLVKDISLSLAAIVGAYVALRGLSTWNRQLKGGVEYELTRRILKITYRLREAIKGVRNPVMWAGEMPSPDPQNAATMSHEQIRFYGMSKAYQQRWDKVSAVRADLQTELLEAEALWENKLHGLFEPLFKLQHELFVTVHFHVMACNPEEEIETRKAMSDIGRKRRDILYDLSGETEDEFSKDLAQAIKSIEAFLKPHLRK